MTGNDSRLLADLRDFLAPGRSDRLGVAFPAAAIQPRYCACWPTCAAPAGPDLAAVTVDHGLRPEAAGEARSVAALCARLGVSHTICRWDGWDGTGNLPDQARRARQI